MSVVSRSSKPCNWSGPTKCILPRGRCDSRPGADGGRRSGCRRRTRRHCRRPRSGGQLARHERGAARGRRAGWRNRRSRSARPVGQPAQVGTCRKGAGRRGRASRELVDHQDQEIRAASGTRRHAGHPAVARALQAFPSLEAVALSRDRGSGRREARPPRGGDAGEPGRRARRRAPSASPWRRRPASSSSDQRHHVVLHGDGEDQVLEELAAFGQAAGQPVRARVKTLAPP